MFFLRLFRRRRQEPEITWHNHVNPDGSEGGRVADTAEIGDNVTIGKTARVMPDTVVPNNTVIPLGTILTPDGPIRFSA